MCLQILDPRLAIQSRDPRTLTRYQRFHWRSPAAEQTAGADYPGELYDSSHSLELVLTTENTVQRFLGAPGRNGGEFSETPGGGRWCSTRSRTLQSSDTIASAVS